MNELVGVLAGSAHGAGGLLHSAYLREALHDVGCAVCLPEPRYVKPYREKVSIEMIYRNMCCGGELLLVCVDCLEREMQMRYSRGVSDDRAMIAPGRRAVVYSTMSERPSRVPIQDLFPGLVAHDIIDVPAPLLFGSIQEAKAYYAELADAINESVTCKLSLLQAV